MTPEAALESLLALEDPEKATEVAAYHKVERRYLGVAVPAIDRLAKDWRKLPMNQRLAIASHLWDSNIHEAMVAAAKCLEQRKMPEDEAVWALIESWVPSFDAWAVADHAAMAGRDRLVADPVRLDKVAQWTRTPHLWSRRAALVFTLPWARLDSPTPEQVAQRERILGWAAGYVSDPEWFIQKAIGWWLRDLSRRDPDRTRGFLNAYGDQMKPFARREASKHLA